MYAALRAATIPMLALGAVACLSTVAKPGPAQREIAWLFDHGGCDCGPVAFASGSAVPS